MTQFSSNNITKQWGLNGMTALVTGGTKGIGHAIVEELAGLGVIVHTCSRNQGELNQCIRDWTAKGFKVTGSVCDVVNREERAKLIEHVSVIFHGKLNILVNNAGTAIPKPAEEFTAEEISFVMTTNFESVFHLCQLAHPLLKESGNGSIVNVSSIAGSIAIPNSAIYSASKAAIDQLTRNLACEWARCNIRTNAVAPGIIKTLLIDAIMENPLGKRALESLIYRSPMLRAGKADEVSSVVAFLCSSAASYVNGQVIHIDGGHIVNGFGSYDD